MVEQSDREDNSWQQFAEYIVDMFLKIRETELRSERQAELSAEFNPRTDLYFIDNPVLADDVPVL